MTLQRLVAVGLLPPLPPGCVCVLSCNQRRARVLRVQYRPPTKEGACVEHRVLFILNSNLTVRRSSSAVCVRARVTDRQVHNRQW
jgi:hypothetical protein